MGRYTRQVCIVVVCGGILAACGTDSPSVPSPLPNPTVAPTPQPPPPQGAYTVSGVVSEVVDGQTVPIEGAHVEDSERHVFVITGPDGSYTITDVPNSRSGTAYIYFQKPGYRSQTRQPFLTSDTRVDVTLARE